MLTVPVHTVSASFAAAASAVSGLAASAAGVPGWSGLPLPHGADRKHRSCCRTSSAVLGGISNVNTSCNTVR